ncbi:hypothetical protein [Streptomyces sp. NBC_01794]|uniref:hypothetical protein n=1 Tax=Streptomyces sp. NBC_01794 TaxID=2975942 RepID=UPI003088D2E9|nr:hypothetical protein OIE54_00375 [Streptomyces sp. NBC_01794]WSB05156.1 hypothetical protein OIE54_41770 [Streptomyces sp. NBC_01794]
MVTVVVVTAIPPLPGLPPDLESPLAIAPRSPSAPYAVMIIGVDREIFGFFFCASAITAVTSTYASPALAESWQCMFLVASKQLTGAEVGLAEDVADADAEEDAGADAEEDAGADAEEDAGADAEEDAGADAEEDAGADEEAAAATLALSPSVDWADAAPITAAGMATAPSSAPAPIVTPISFLFRRLCMQGLPCWWNQQALLPAMSSWSTETW